MKIYPENYLEMEVKLCELFNWNPNRSERLDTLISWNDNPKRTHAEVLELLKKFGL